MQEMKFFSKIGLKMYEFCGNRGKLEILSQRLKEKRTSEILVDQKRNVLGKGLTWENFP